MVNEVLAVLAYTLEFASSPLAALTTVAESLSQSTSTQGSLGDLLGAVTDRGFFDRTLFKKPVWTGLMQGVRIGLCLIGALLLMFEVRARRMGVKIAEKTKRNVAIALTVLSFGTYFDFGNPNVRYSEYYHRHELYHYYLGSKFAPELGYSLLYDCTMIAEIDNGRKAQVENREFRDLRVNLIRQAKDTDVLKNPEICRARFTPERWDAFRKDIDWFYRSSGGSYWERMQQDHGYNPPPVWTMTGKAISSLAPASGDFFQALAAIDVSLQAGMVLLLFWAFGYRVAAVSTLFWGCNAAANFYWTGGAFLRQDWLFLLVASVCLARKKYYVGAGAALMWSALLRVFPAALFGGWAAMVMIYAVRRMLGKPPAAGDKGILSYLHPSHRRLILGSVLAFGVLFPASVVTTGGLETYKAFVHHISVHKKTPLTNHMGLPTIMSHTWKGRMRFTRDDNLDDAFKPWKDGRNERKEARQPFMLAITAACFLWIAWALRRSYLLWLGPALSLVLVMCITDLTCYYYSMYIVAGVLVAARRSIGIALLSTAAASTLLLGRDIGYADVGLTGFYYVDDNFTAQSYLFFLFSLLSLWAYSRPFSLSRLTGFLKGQKEPAPGPRGQFPTGVAGS